MTGDPHPHRGRCAAAAIVVAIALPATASAEASFLFSQTATSAVVTGAAHGQSTVIVRTGHAPLVALEERPGRRTATMRERLFAGLWRGTFRTDPPNAVLTGRDAKGRNRRVVVTLTGAAVVAGGVRYRMRALRGRIPTRLAPANLTIDGVPAGAIGYALGSWEPVVNALMFPPMTVVTPAAPNVTVPPGGALTIGTTSGLRYRLAVGTLSLGANANVTVHTGVIGGLLSAVVVQAGTIVVAPGARFILPDSPSVVTVMTSACASAGWLSVDATLTTVQQPPGTGPPTTTPWPLAATRGQGCTSTWTLNAPPQPTWIADPLIPEKGRFLVTSSTQATLTNGTGAQQVLTDVTLVFTNVKGPSAP